MDFLVDYRMDEGLVLNNSREVRKSGGITYLPIYYVMFPDASGSPETEILL